MVQQHEDTREGGSHCCARCRERNNDDLEWMTVTLNIFNINVE